MRFGSQASWLAAGRMIAAAISAVWFVVLARALSLDEFGSLALLLSLGLMMAVLTDLGLTGLLADLVAKQSSTARSGTRVVLKQRIALSFVASWLTGVAFVLATDVGNWAVPVVFAVSTFANAVYSTYSAVFRATGHAGYEAANEVASRLLLLVVGGAVVLLLGGSLLAVVGVYAAVDLLSLLVLSIVFLRSTRPDDTSIDPQVLSLRSARTLAAAGIVSTFYFRIDTWLLAMIKGERTIGRYAAAYRFFDALLLPMMAVSALSIPYTTGLHGRALYDRLKHISLFAAGVTLPFAAGVFIFAEPIMRIVFGARYVDAVPALRLLALGAVVSAAVGAVLPPLALRSGRVALAMLASLVVNVVANLVVIPKYGGTGAAAVTVACEVLLGLGIALQMNSMSRRDPVLEGVRLA